MAISPDFMNDFKKKFRLKYLGLWWTQPRSEENGDFSPKKFMVHYELDRTDIHKNVDILKVINQNSLSIDNHFFGTAMSIIPPFTPFLDDEVKMKITRNVRKQQIMAKNVQCTTIHGVNVTNWADGNKENTLHRQLMALESIYNKTVVNSKKKKKFRGRLFYSIIPNQRSKCVTFYFSKINVEEARGVARGLPLLLGITSS